ncbi:hypothetical protein, partial [Paracoccus beibuensis]|uniref:hypothetical protein n=1 Tax=Paracoccus beibuensis TaxID=547602 RepID=UPI00223FF2C2
MVVVLEAFDGRVLDRAVHPLHLAIGCVSDLVEIGWRRDLQVDTHPPDRRRQRQGDHAMKQNTD